MEIWFDENGEWRKEPFVSFPSPEKSLLQILHDHQQKYGCHNTQHNFVVLMPNEQLEIEKMARQLCWDSKENAAQLEFLKN